jgi:Trk K+ transport system NAD-binding subunit
MTIEEITNQLPSGVLVALVARGGDARVPPDDFTVEYGDRITVIGERADVREAMSFVHPDG